MKPPPPGRQYRRWWLIVAAQDAQATVRDAVEAAREEFPTVFGEQ